MYFFALFARAAKLRLCHVRFGRATGPPLARDRAVAMAVRASSSRAPDFSHRGIILLRRLPLPFGKHVADDPDAVPHVVERQAGRDKTSSRSHPGQRRRGLCREFVRSGAPCRRRNNRLRRRSAEEALASARRDTDREPPQFLNRIFVELHVFTAGFERAMPAARPEYFFRIHAANV